MCKHQTVRFLSCSCADRWPGVWVCDDCEEKVPARVVANTLVERTSGLLMANAGHPIREDDP